MSFSLIIRYKEKAKENFNPTVKGTDRTVG